MPIIFGYDERDLNRAHQRGVDSGRSGWIYELIKELDKVCANLDYHIGGMPHPALSDIIRSLAEIWQREQSELDRQEEEIQSRQRKYDGLLDKLRTVESGRLYTTAQNLDAERDCLRPKLATLQNEFAELQFAHQIEVQKLESEVKQLEELLVDYAGTMHNAR